MSNKYSKDFFAALEALEKEKGIPQSVFLEALENALISACKKQYSGTVGAIDIKMNPEKGTIDFYSVKTVVEEVEDAENEISLADARAVKKGYKIGDRFTEKFVPEDLDRKSVVEGKSVA